MVYPRYVLLCTPKKEAWEGRKGKDTRHEKKIIEKERNKNDMSRVCTYQVCANVRRGMSTISFLLHVVLLLPTAKMSLGRNVMSGGYRCDIVPRTRYKIAGAWCIPGIRYRYALGNPENFPLEPRCIIPGTLYLCTFCRFLLDANGVELPGYYSAVIVNVSVLCSKRS